MLDHIHLGKPIYLERCYARGENTALIVAVLGSWMIIGDLETTEVCFVWVVAIFKFRPFIKGLYPSGDPAILFICNFKGVFAKFDDVIP